MWTVYCKGGVYYVGMDICEDAMCHGPITFPMCFGKKQRRTLLKDKGCPFEIQFVFFRQASTFFTYKHQKQMKVGKHIENFVKIVSTNKIIQREIQNRLLFLGFSEKK